MFDTIEKNFTRYSLLILSLVVLISFFTIYLFVRVGVYQDIDKELKSLDRFLNEPPVSAPTLPAKEGKPKEFSHSPPALGFVAVLSQDPVKIITPFEEDFTSIPYQDLLDTALQQSKAEGTVSLQGSRWRYRVMDSQGSAKRIHFVEISKQTRILRTIIGSAVGIYVVLLFLFWWLSRRFARASVTPAKKAYQQQTEFIANVSHELKTPLAVIKTNAEALSLSPESQSAQETQWLSNIETEIERMNLLISDMVDASLVASVPLALEKVQLSALVREVLLSFEPLFYENHIQLNTTLGQSFVVTDPGQLRRACYLLLENAANYTPEGGTVMVTTTATPSPRISICNTGDGITQQDEEKIFQRFYRGDTARTRKNNSYGLGLPIAKQIVEALGGTLTLSVKDTICFTIRL